MAVVDKQIVPNLWAPGTEGDERPTVDLTYADEVQIQDKFDPWTHVMMKKHGRMSTIEDSGEEFGPEARLPRKEKEVWDLDGLGFEARVEPMEACRAPKRKRGAKSTDQPGAGQRSSPAALSQVLPNRLSQNKAPPKK